MTTNTTNLFKQLYSTPNLITNSGYVCSNAIDEDDTSFDISGNSGQITDSNGNVLAEIDLSQIHSDGLTEYKTETKVLAPYTSYLIQGTEHGETYGTYSFGIPIEICDYENYSFYVNVDFDIRFIYNFEIYCIHICTYKYRTHYGNIITLLLDMLNLIHCNVSVSIHSKDDKDYLVFQGLEEGYWFDISNVAFFPILNDSANFDGSDGDYYDSPFKTPIIDVDFILDMLAEFRPGEYPSEDDENAKLTNPFKYPLFPNRDIDDEDEYEIDCKLYTAILDFANLINKDFKEFCRILEILKQFAECYDLFGNIIDAERLKKLIEKYPSVYTQFFVEGSVFYDYNIHTIVEMFEYIREYVILHTFTGPYFVEESDIDIVNCTKYINGALRGLVAVPQFPKDDESSVLLLSHVPAKIMMHLGIDHKELERHLGVRIDPLNMPKNLGVNYLADVRVNEIDENETHMLFINKKYMLENVTTNGLFHLSYDCYHRALDFNEFLELQFTRGKMPCRKCGKEDDTWVDPNVLYLNDCEPYKELFDSHMRVGLYGYMKYLNDNDLWLRFGDVYMIVGRKDNPLTTVCNLLNSVLVYNPNPIPIRVKFMIFS